jgi:hypothetical protein
MKEVFPISCYLPYQTQIGESLYSRLTLSPDLEDILLSQETNYLHHPQTQMSQYLIAFCYLFTTVLLFLAFYIIRAVPFSSPLNIDLYRDNTIISLAIYNPAELSYQLNSTKETLNIQ